MLKNHMFHLFKQKEGASALRQEASAVVLQARSVVQRTAEHTSALGALFAEEVKEYTAHQLQRVILAIVACVLLLGAYFVLCAAVAVLLSIWLHPALSLGVVFLVNLVVALLLLRMVRSMGGKKLAPATAQELKNDLECLKLLCKESSKP